MFEFGVLTLLLALAMLAALALTFGVVILALMDDR